MKIALVGPGIMEIPPKGWGAVESLIWDYATELGELGHEGTIINTPDRTQIIRDLTKEKYDYIHVHYDVFKKVFAFHNDLLEFPTLSYFRTNFDDETFIKNFKEVCYVEE